jgi:hypothetical protein
VKESSADALKFHRKGSGCCRRAKRYPLRRSGSEHKRRGGRIHPVRESTHADPHRACEPVLRIQRHGYMAKFSRRPATVVLYRLPVASRTKPAEGFAPSGSPVKLCNTLSVPDASSLKTIPQVGGVAPLEFGS